MNVQRIPSLLEIFLQVSVKILKYKIELVIARDDLEELNNSWVVALLEQAHLSQCRTRQPFVTVLDFDLLERYNLQTEKS